MCLAQQNDITEVSACFSALIVTDMDSSIQWYSSMLGFELASSSTSEELGFKQSNLNNGNTRLELIELNAALLPQEAIPDYNTKTRLVGIFKIGFVVPEFERLIAHLQKRKAVFHGNIVKDQESGKRMVIIKDPDGNRIQLFE